MWGAAVGYSPDPRPDGMSWNSDVVLQLPLEPSPRAFPTGAAGGGECVCDEGGPAPNPPPLTAGALRNTLPLSHTHTHFLFLLFAANCLLGDAGGCASGKAQLAPL